MNMPQALAAGVRQDVALASGIALNGMAAVRPKYRRGLFERARGGTASTESAANGLHGVAAAVGAAHAGQSLGQQAAGQNGAAFAQPDAQAQPGNSTEREQQVSEQVAFWVHNKNQNASLSVEHEGRAIQVQVSLQGNEAHVRFGASEAQARDWLGNGATSCASCCRPRACNWPASAWMRAVSPAAAIRQDRPTPRRARAA